MLRIEGHRRVDGQLSPAPRGDPRALRETERHRIGVRSACNAGRSQSRGAWTPASSGPRMNLPWKSMLAVGLAGLGLFAWGLVAAFEGRDGALRFMGAGIGVVLVTLAWWMARSARSSPGMFSAQSNEDYEAQPGKRLSSAIAAAGLILYGAVGMARRVVWVPHPDTLLHRFDGAAAFVAGLGMVLAGVGIYVRFCTRWRKGQLVGGLGILALFVALFGAVAIQVS